jgi:hypothetical protein
MRRPRRLPRFVKKPSHSPNMVPPDIAYAESHCQPPWSIPGLALGVNSGLLAGVAFEHATSGDLNRAVERVLVPRADNDLSLAGHFVPLP